MTLYVESAVRVENVPKGAEVKTNLGWRRVADKRWINGGLFGVMLIFKHGRVPGGELEVVFKPGAVLLTRSSKNKEKSDG